MKVATRLTTLLAVVNYGVATILLALHVLGAVTLVDPFRQSVALWVIVNAIVLVAGRVRGVQPSPKEPACPYCGQGLSISRLQCPDHGDLTPERR